MKLTKQQLKQIIKEELEAALSEGGLDMSKLHKPTSLPGKTKKSRPTDDSKKDLDMSKLYKPTSLPGKSEEDDSEELPEAFDPSKMKAPKAFKGDEDAARKRAAASVVQQDLKSRSQPKPGKAAAGWHPETDALSVADQAGDISSPIVDQAAKWADDASDALVRTGGAVGGAAKGLSKYIPGVGIASTITGLKDTFTDPKTSIAQKAGRVAGAGIETAADLATIAPAAVGRAVGQRALGALGGAGLGAVYAGYEGGKALQKPLAKAGIIPDLGKPVGVTDIDWRPSEFIPDVGKHTGGTFDPKKMKAPKGWDPDKKDAAIARATKVKRDEDDKTQMRQYKSRSGLAERDDEDDIPKPGKNLAEAWGFSMDLDKLNESTSGHVTPAKD